MTNSQHDAGRHDIDRLNKDLVSLHKTLWRRTLKANKASIFLAVMIGIYGIAAAMSVMFPAIIDWNFSRGTAYGFSGVAALGALILVILSAMMPAGEKQLFPADMRTMPVRPREVRPGFVRMMPWSTRSIICIVYSIGYAIVCGLMLARDSSILWAPVFAVGVAFTAVIAIIGTDCVALLGAAAQKSKSTKRTMIASLGGMAIYFAIIWGLDVGTMESIPTATIGKILAFTPFGAPTGFASALIDGSWILAVIQLLLAIAYLYGAWALWNWIFRKGFDAPESLGSAGPANVKSRSGVITLGPLPGNSPFWGEFSRTLRYIVRDSRLLLTLVLAPVMAVFYAVTSGGGEMMFIGCIILALIGGLLACNDYGYDGPSMWSKMVAPARQSTLFLARHWAHAIGPLTMLVVYSVVFLALTPDKPFGLAVTVVAVGFFLSSLSLSALFTVFNPYPTSAPGTNPWTDKSGYSASAFIAVFGVLFLGWIPIAPGVIILFGAFTQAATFHPQYFAGLAVAVAIPIVLYCLVLFFATKHVDRRTPEIFAKVRNRVS